MAAANGFVATEPDTQYGDAALAFVTNWARAQKFVAGGSGTQEISKVGFWGYCPSGSASVRMAIYTHDAANDCPEAMVSNSETSSITVADVLETQYAHTYSTKPQVTGGTTYWLALFASGDTCYATEFATGGDTSFAYTSLTFPTWPTGTQWEASDDQDYDLSFYAVYSAFVSGQFARPSSDVADGNWLNEASSNTNLYESINETTASDTDYIRSGATPSNDTCTVGLSSIIAPTSGTVTLRVRAKYV